jgi:alkylresorcinol/alkylpyrone synthase
MKLRGALGRTGIMTITHRRSPQPVALLGLGTAVPAHVIRQTDAAAVAHELFADRYPEYARLGAVFETSGIATRHAVRPIDWYRTPRNWSDRTAAYLEGAVDLFATAAGRALRAADLEPDDVDVVVTVSSTGIATPSLDSRYLDALGIGRHTRRVPVFGLGCGGGVAGLAIAADLARGAPGRTVLLVAVELCTLSFRLDTLSKANIVATALFGDGAAACVLRAGAPAAGEVAVTATGEHTWPNTLDLMGWQVDPDGFGVIFARAIPPFARTNVGPAVSGILDRGGLALADIGRFVCHPGGARVVDALEQSIGLTAGSLDHEREVLRTHGNMSAPTVLFVLERVLAAGAPERAALVAMGPGFTASCAVLERAA